MPLTNWGTSTLWVSIFCNTDKPLVDYWHFRRNASIRTKNFWITTTSLFTRMVSVSTFSKWHNFTWAIRNKCSCKNNFWFVIWARIWIRLLLIGFEWVLYFQKSSSCRWNFKVSITHYLSVVLYSASFSITTLPITSLILFTPIL